MDEIDTKQQQEIVALQDNVKSHARFITNIVYAFVFFALIQAGVVFLILEKDSNCPHKDCPHHVKFQQ